ncbi:hypothetical protein [Actinoplanes xinjiangensis]|uniref:Uncharacterized protein n=1 Tax=Actinoplanes xinjiangensis TaxID=512350 RepID=A0A316F5R4_9ACTN|nr:hypothetical protein [Actinoplanes xinjiangensis]PWK40174.1 hypothetical protein BC793_120113 [Actinoplanes xinjiangensis]GIF42489.1 hypothetical protein Axi01nite_68000 [Actinoplanes xinjiangensis]
MPSGNELTSAAMVTCCPGVQGISSSVDPLPALTRGRISHVYQNYVCAENHAAANRWLINGQAGFSERFPPR